LDADVASAQLQATGSHLNAFSLAANHSRSFALRETLVKFEISFADIGNYDDGDIPGTHRGGATPMVVLWSPRTARLKRRQDWNEKTAGVKGNEQSGLVTGDR
jgi:hypothetical protein